jgi:hypothetical protein
MLCGTHRRDPLLSCLLLLLVGGKHLLLVQHLLLLVHVLLCHTLVLPSFEFLSFEVEHEHAGFVH